MNWMHIYDGCIYDAVFLFVWTDMSILGVGFNQSYQYDHHDLIKMIILMIHHDHLPDHDSHQHHDEDDDQGEGGWRVG